MRKLIWLIPLLAIFTLAYGRFGQGEGGGGGTGDMTKAVYDADVDDIVDSATSIVGGAASLAAVSDSCDSVRVHAQGYIEDSLDYYLLIGRHNDTIAVLRGNISAYIEDSLDFYTLISVLNDSIAKLRANAADSAKAQKLDDFTMPDDNTDLNVTTSAHGLVPKLSNVSTEYLSGTGVYSTPTGGGVMSGSAIMDSINNLTQIYFGDTLYLYNPATNDTVLFSYVDAAGKLHVGSPGTLEADSAKLGGGTTLIKAINVGSYLAWITNASDTTVGIPVADTTQLGSATLSYMISLFGNSSTSSVSITKNSSGQLDLTSFHIAKQDSLTVDSLSLLINADADSNTVDSICLIAGRSLSGVSSTAFWGDGADKDVDAGYQRVTWTGMSCKIAPWDRVSWKVYGKKMAANGDLAVHNFAAWCR